MSQSDEKAAEMLAGAEALLLAGVENPDALDNLAFRKLLAAAVRAYAAKAELGMRSPLPPEYGGVTVTEAMLLITDLLHALDVQLFELSMWQAMSGNSIAPHHRIDTADAATEVDRPSPFAETARREGDAK